jgi:signal transduction histidine kinase
MKNSPLEPGILGLFRVFLVIQLFLVLGNVLVHSQPDNFWCALAFGVGNIVLLLLYLSIPALQKSFGRFYLPLGIAYSAIFSLVLQDLFLNAGLAVGKVSSQETAWQLFLFLFIPLVLLAWQYDLKAVVVYCVLTAFIDHGLMRHAQADFLNFSETYHRLLFIRVLAFLITGYIISNIMTRFREQRSTLEHANRELAHYASTLEQLTVSRERNRMARELHDTLAHTLSGIAVQLEAAQSLWKESPDEAHAMLTRSLAMTRSGLSDTRRALQDLRAAPLEELGLEAALRSLATESTDRAGLRLEWLGPSPLPELAPNIEQGLYRIAQECFENIIRHAGATSVRVESAFQAGMLALSIEDDGQGFDFDEVNNDECFGLQGMRERADMMGGELTITSAAGQGTKVQLKVKVWNGH